MGKFLALITVAAMALFIAGPAMAQEGPWTLVKSYTYDKDVKVDVDKDIKVLKDIDIDVDGDLEATGGIDVQGDVVFKELDVEVQDEEVVNKFFELHDNAVSSWEITGTGVMNAAEVLQNGFDNEALIDQNPFGIATREMNVGLQYQVGIRNVASIEQGTHKLPPDGNGSNTNNFAKQIQIGGAFDPGERNSATITQH